METSSSGNASSNEDDDEGVKISYPIAIAYFVTFGFINHLNFASVRTLLPSYLTRELEVNRANSFFVARLFLIVMYCFCFVGSVISDIWLGRFKTILWLAIFYDIGMFLLAIGGIPMKIPYVTDSIFSIIGLMVVAMTTGVIRGLLAVFGGDQFNLPEETDKFCDFVSMLYFGSNVGACGGLIIVTGMMKRLQCFGEDKCYSIICVVPATILFIGIFIFLAGRRKYKLVRTYWPEYILSFKAITHALSVKRKSQLKREHWLDHAQDKFDEFILNDLKNLFRILKLYLPLPIFWALFDQIDSGWAIQASHMNGDMGEWKISTDQWIFLNPLLVVICIPLFKVAIYPLLSEIGIKRPLQKMVIGCILTGIAFIMSGLLEFKLEKTYPIIPRASNAQLRIYNGESCEYDITTNIEGQHRIILKALDVYTYRDIFVPGDTFILEYKILPVVQDSDKCPEFKTKPVFIPEKTAYSIFLHSKHVEAPIAVFEDKVKKPKYGLPYGRVLSNIEPYSTVAWTPADDTDNILYEESAHETKTKEFELGTYAILVEDTKVFELKLEVGGAYTLIINEEDNGDYKTQLHIITEPNSVHLIWQVPQYIFLTTGEIMYSITGIQFSITQAPLSMKALVLAFWIMTKAFGNAIVSITSITSGLKQSYQFLFLGCLMLVDVLIFAYLAKKFKPTNPHGEYIRRQRNTGVDDG